MSLQLALIQMDIAYGDPEANKNKVIQKIGEAASHKPDIIVLPELWNTGYDLARLDEIADPDGSETKKLMQNLAKKYQVHIVAGSIANKTDSGFYNTLYAFDKQGVQVGEYSKAHRFRLMDEDQYLQAGHHMGLFTLENLPCAGVICYDIRFPEWTRKAALNGAELLFVPAEWPKPRLDHWRQLLLTRAIENQWFVIACNRAGSDPNNVFAGHSIVIDPWGEVIAEAGTEETILYATIDPEQVAEVRSRIPIFSDRRPELYAEI
ncbi:MAG: carbon-nitrogen family hydrolase [Thermoactinomyces sp.]